MSDVRPLYVLGEAYGSTKGKDMEKKDSVRYHRWGEKDGDGADKEVKETLVKGHRIYGLCGAPECIVCNIDPNGAGPVLEPDQASIAIHTLTQIGIKRGNLTDMVHSVIDILDRAGATIKTLDNNKRSLEFTIAMVNKALSGNDVSNSNSRLAKQVAKLNGMLEITKMRLNRYVEEGKDEYLCHLYNELDEFLKPPEDDKQKETDDGEYKQVMR